MASNPALTELPDQHGRFGRFGGQYVPETLTAALGELEAAWKGLAKNDSFWHEFNALLKNFVGRPTPMWRATNFEQELNGPRLFVKREDIAHTGAHKINNALGQALLAKSLGKTRVVAETGAGQHGVATAAACAVLGLECVVYMGATDMVRQAPNVQRMALLGAEVRQVITGTATLKDAVNEAIREWVSSVTHTHYLLGSAVGPHPYPALVRDLQAVIGREARAQIVEQAGRLPDLAIACVGGGSNAIGLFSSFSADTAVQLIGVEAAGKGLNSGRHAAAIAAGQVGVLHGALSFVLQDEYGQISAAHSVSAGLDYPGVGPEHAYLSDSGRVKYVSVTDDQAVAAFSLFARTEGIVPALEPAHALAFLLESAKELAPDALILLLLSGRGDKDLDTVTKFRLDGLTN